MNYKCTDGGDRTINDSCYYSSILELPYFVFWLVKTQGYSFNNFIFQNLKDYKQVLQNFHVINR